VVIPNSSSSTESLRESLLVRSGGIVRAGLTLGEVVDGGGDAGRDPHCGVGAVEQGGELLLCHVQARGLGVLSSFLKIFLDFEFFMNE